MKVLFITNCPAPYRVEFFNELARYCELTVLFEMENPKNRSKDWKSEETVQFQGIFLESKFQWQEGAFCPEVGHYIQDFKKDVIIVGGYSTPTGMFSIIYMKRHHIPFVLNSDGGMMKQDPWLKRRIKSFYIGAASWWLSTGENCTKYLVHYGADKNRIYQYPFTSIHENEIWRVTAEQRQSIREKLGITENKVVLFVGSFIYRKGLDILLNACKEFEDTAVVLVGGDDISEFVSNAGVEFKCHIYIAGFQSKQDVKKYYQAADVFALPTREDIWGLVINEAMAAGLPVVTTDQCGAGLELIHNGENGYVICHEDVFELRERLLKILNNENVRLYMGDRNVELIKAYSIEKMAERHSDILKEITSEMDQA